MERCGLGLERLRSWEFGVGSVESINRLTITNELLNQ